MQTLTLTNMCDLLPPRPDDSNKASFGHVLNIAGSMNYKGAAYLSSLSALRVGAGYVTLASSPSVCQSVSHLSANIVTLPLETQAFSSAQDTVNPEILAPSQCDALLKRMLSSTAISIGPGLGLINQELGSNLEFFSALLNKLKTTHLPIILDADGLNYLSVTQAPLPRNCLLTPHPKELARLLSVNVGDIQQNRALYAKKAAKKYHVIVVLKGHNTVITDGELVFINPTGGSILAKAGTGDVLTGMISGFCAQSVSPLSAACLGVYLHGLAAEFAEKELSAYSMLASELIDYIPNAMIEILKAKHQN
ncbi:NAD(P)H-hydrate dehydratase [Shewanella sp. SR44-3]|uniref:NAD(P)H-hydrate dehydratase n=1 Tax=Shewanella sp. SR44-3 TaxID=2760936 RepID=UPI0015FABEF1|nr:NAD(P)H-hydrate dehydratase [Shewanella sp. SR44-3]MBB1270616.1 NAD(P)H-hydrate dehydratase [Shewanella sp. SR44-3]